VQAVQVVQQVLKQKPGKYDVPLQRGASKSDHRERARATKEEFGSQMSIPAEQEIDDRPLEGTSFHTPRRSNSHYNASNLLPKKDLVLDETEDLLVA
jgi:hypothetical protein